VFQDPRFSRVGTPIELPDGTLEVQVVALMFSFVPAEIRVPANRRIRFRMTSVDVTHGFMVAGTNVNTMLIPGYVSQLTAVFPRAGDHLIVCHEFCGNGHHSMYARIIVEAAQ
jgi:cytochrome c oxidase subunit 2